MTTAANIDLARLAHDLGLALDIVQRTLTLLDDGNTVPFITRFRKEQTGGLNEEQLQRIQHSAAKERMLAERKQTILRSIESQGKLTNELAAQVNSARTLKWLEDVYLPFKPKKQTLATQARQRGLEPLAARILTADPPVTDLQALAADGVCPEKGLTTVDDVLVGIGHILAEQFSERADVRGKLRRIMRRNGVLTCERVESTERATAATTVDERGSQASPEQSTAVAEAPPAQLPPAPPMDEVNDSPPAVEATNGASGGEPAVEIPSLGDVPTAVEDSPVVAEVATTVAPPPTVSPGPLAKRRLSRKQAAKERKRRLFENAFKDYYQFRESINRLPPHRVLAINRGERAKVLRVRLECAGDEMSHEAMRLFVPEQHPHAALLRDCVTDGLQRLVIPSLEREIRRELTEEAEEHAVNVFVGNLRKLLLQAPVRGKRVLAIDPAFRSGCKLVALDEFGKILEHGTAFLIGTDEQRAGARSILAEMVRRNGIGLIAIGNGAACRETEQFVSDVLGHELQDQKLAYVIVNEAGASVYSTSQVGREELPDCDAVMRSAVSIGRRLLDPLSELVKINPANIGVGMYQHDVKAKHLRESLDAVVNSCVNFVGVDANTASPALLSYVSGLNQLTARRLYEYRLQNGPFRSREQIKNVPGIGEATFVQAAGFLKIMHGENPLDATSIHPESYGTACRLLERLNIPVDDLRSSTGNGASEPAVSAPAVSAPAELAPTAPEVAAVAPEVAAVAPQMAAVAPEVAAIAPDSAEAAPDSAPPVLETAVATEVAPTELRSVSSTALAERLVGVNPEELSRELEIGEMTLRDILAALARTGRDPRDEFLPPPFRTGIMKLDDLKPGVELQGTVLNVVDFGAFVDIGISDSALIHISKLADRYVRDPQEVVSVGDVLKVWVIAVDKERRRVSLTAIDPHAPLRPRPRREDRRPRRAKPAPAPATMATNTGAPPPRVTTVRHPPRRQPPKPFTKPRQRTPQKPPKPVRPITTAMLDGQQPMRSFSDLMQFYEKKKTDDGETPPQS